MPTKETIGSPIEFAPERDNPYLDYRNRPIILGDAELAQRTGVVSVDGDLRVRLPSGEVIRPRGAKSLVDHTMRGLLEDLTPGTSFGDELRALEYSKYQAARTVNPQFPAYGVYVYYSDRDELVTFMSDTWNKRALLARNSLLIRDKAQPMTWEKQRELFGSLRIGIAGASIGKNVFLLLLATLRPQHIKIADLKPYKQTNANRTQLAYWEIGENKAEVAALQAHEIDPFQPISVYSEGLHAENINDFMNGNSEIGEPPIDIMVEVMDDLEYKVRVGEIARDFRMPLFRITDLSTAYQIDFRDNKTIPNLPLSQDVTDKALLAALRKAQENPGERRLFFDFAFKLIGRSNLRKVPEFLDLITGRIETPFSKGIPQLGAAAFGGASQASIMIAQWVLGNTLPERTFHNLKVSRPLGKGR